MAERRAVLMSLDIDNPVPRLTTRIAAQNQVRLEASTAPAEGAARCDTLVFGVERSERRQRRNRRWAGVAGFALGVAALTYRVATGAWFAKEARDRVSYYASTASTQRLTLGEGAFVVLGEGARVRRWGSEGRALALEAGQVEVRYAASAGAQVWTWSAGAYQLSGGAADFDMHWQPESQLLIVHLHTGSVTVDDTVLGLAHELQPGEQLRLSSAGRASGQR